ncbi:MAG TPA: hypothetical protein VHJ40_06425 [Actinomycetota bacterium]|nr:hypothetical protein [Actinomycetota bacterium]
MIDRTTLSGKTSKHVPGSRAFAGLDAKDVKESDVQVAAVPAPVPAPAPLVPAVTQPEAPAPQPAAAANPLVPAQPQPAAASALDPYKGLGAWVDIYDYAIRDVMDIPAAVEEMANRDVRTLYLQTGRWKDPQDIVNPVAVGLFLDSAKKRGMKVVGWYVPGFGDMDRDVRRSVAVMHFRSPVGNRFDGFAPDIETKEEVSRNTVRFNAGVVEYSRRLREALPNAVLGAIVLDAKNNLRAPAAWANFPWPEIGKYYDIILPMAYWSVTKAGACQSREFDTSQYIREVATLTENLMGMRRPFHMIGGIADCITEGEVKGFVTGSKETGSLGASLYDFASTQSSPVKIWHGLSSINT